jgi:hypothetical protein
MIENFNFTTDGSTIWIPKQLLSHLLKALQSKTKPNSMEGISAFLKTYYLTEFQKENSSLFNNCNSIKLNKAGEIRGLSDSTIERAINGVKGGEKATVNYDLLDFLCYATWKKSLAEKIADISINWGTESIYSVYIPTYAKAEINKYLQSNPDVNETKPNKAISDKREVENYIIERLKNIYRFPEGLAPKEVNLSISDIHFLTHLQNLNETLDIPWELIEERVTSKKGVFKGIKIATAMPNDEVTVGFFILYPITDICEELISSGKIIGSRQFKFKDIASDFKSAASIYISHVYGIDRSSKAYTYLLLTKELQFIFAKYPNIKSLFVRPTTKDGLFNVENNHFKLLGTCKDLYHLNAHELMNALGYKE